VGKGLGLFPAAHWLCVWWVGMSWDNAGVLGCVGKHWMGGFSLRVQTAVFMRTVVRLVALGINVLVRPGAAGVVGPCDSPPSSHLAVVVLVGPLYARGQGQVCSAVLGSTC
jgi:hypothetical protein